MKDTSLKTSTMVQMIAIVLISAFAVTIWFYYSNIGKMKELNLKKVNTFQQTFQTQFDTKKQDLLLVMDLIRKNNEWISLFETGDRESLSQETVELFKTKLKPVYGIKQFQFHLPPATSFFRVHKPGKFGDDLSAFRNTVIQANQQKKDITGIEVGRGGLGLRVVVPISKKNGEHLGSVEFGADAKTLFNASKDITNSEYSIGVFKEVFENARRFEDKQNDVVHDKLVNYFFSTAKVKSLMKEASLDLDGNLELNTDQYFSSAFPLTDYSGKKIGEIRVFINQQEQLAALYSSLLYGILAIFVFAAILLSGLYITLNRKIFKPISNVVVKMKDIVEGEGDLATHLQIRRMDEIGQVAAWFNTFMDNIRDIVVHIRSNSDTLNIESKDLLSRSGMLSETAGHMSLQSKNVSTQTEQMNINVETIASTAEEMSLNSATVSSTAEQMSTNMHTVASAIEEMSAAITEIADRSKSGEEITKKASEEAKQATETMHALGTAAYEIGEVTHLIKRIAEQTNLLALNATIEAASAGDAGKGFAVVANEIKELANQSAQAAEKISDKVQGVQTNSEEAVRVMNEIAEIVNTINGSVTQINHSVEQQTATTHEIANNVSQASNGVGQIASAIGEIAKGADDLSRHSGEAAKSTAQISEAIKVVEKASESTAYGTTITNLGVGEVANVGARLFNLVSQFNTGESIFDARKVKEDHIQWKLKLDQFLTGKLDMEASDVSSDTECSFGKWFYNFQVSDEVRERPCHKAILVHHKNIHKMAREIVDIKNSGDIEMAKKKLIEFETERYELFLKIDEFLAYMSK